MERSPAPRAPIERGRSRSMDRNGFAKRHFIPSKKGQIDPTRGQRLGTAPRGLKWEVPDRYGDEKRMIVMMNRFSASKMAFLAVCALGLIYGCATEGTAYTASRKPSHPDGRRTPRAAVSTGRLQ